MVCHISTHTIAPRSEVEIERDDVEEIERRYWASCKGLSGCQIRASSKAKALRKIRQAIDVWLDLADRQLMDQVHGIRDMIDMRVPD